MRRGLIIIIAIVAVMATSGTCKKNSSKCHFDYSIKNNSSSDIYFIWSGDSALTSLSYNQGSSPATYKAKANTLVKNIHRTCFENEILASDTKKIYIFIFDAAVIESTPWDSVKKNNMLRKRYNLTELQLDSAQWVINYP